MKKTFLTCIVLLSAAICHAQTQLWGMAAAKGATNGTIFKTDGDGTGYTDVHTFDNAADGLEPYGSLAIAADGKLYGLTSAGGAYGCGVLFQLDPATGIYSKKYDFDSLTGKTPYGSVCATPGGKLYGMTYAGGTSNLGVLFEYDIITGIFSKKADLASEIIGNPYGSLSLAGEQLYGLSSRGGADATGTFFSYNSSSGVFTRLHNFISGPAGKGYEPKGHAIQTTDGKFYGLSAYGGAMGSGGGVIFRYDSSAPFLSRMTALHRLSELSPGAAQGHELEGSLVQASNGNLYGLTALGGFDNAGVLFEFDLTTGTYANRHSLDSLEGYMPHGSLMQAADGNLYGLLTTLVARRGFLDLILRAMHLPLPLMLRVHRTILPL